MRRTTSASNGSHDGGGGGGGGGGGEGLPLNIMTFSVAVARIRPSKRFNFLGNFAVIFLLSSTFFTPVQNQCSLLFLRKLETCFNPECMRACVRVSVCACVRACVRACVSE